MSSDAPPSGKPKAPDPEAPSTEGWSNRDHAALPAQPLAPKTAALQARRRRRLAGRPGPGHAARSDLQLSTADASLAYQLSGHRSELFVQRTSRCPEGSEVELCMLFDSSADFVRWCDAEPLRFDEPMLHQRLRRHGLAFFESVGSRVRTRGNGGSVGDDLERSRVPDDHTSAALLETVVGLASAADPPAALRLLERATALLGADAAVFTSFVRDDATLASYRYLLACDPAWGLQYTRNGWCRDDPWLRYALYNTGPIRADELPALNAQERWVVEGAAQFGFGSAAIFPVPTAAAQSRVCVLSLGSRREDFFTGDGWGLLRVQARCLAMELGDWMHGQLRAELMARARISDDELDLLRHQQRGHSSKVIAAALRTEPGTIDCRFHRLSLKLCAANRRAALRIAEIYGLI